MIGRIAISKPQPFPLVLRYTDIHSYVFTLGFVLLDVLAPWVCHQFHLAVPTFLPWSDDKRAFSPMFSRFKCISYCRRKLQPAGQPTCRQDTRPIWH